MRYHEKKHFVLEEMCKLGSIFSPTQIQELVKSEVSGDLLVEIIDSFKKEGHVIDNSDGKTLGYSVKESTKVFMLNGGYKKQFADNEFKELVEKPLTKFNYDLRLVVFYVALGGALVGLLSLFKSCIDDKENKSEIKKLQIELKEVKTSVDSLSSQRKAD